MIDAPKLDATIERARKATAETHAAAETVEQAKASLPPAPPAAQHSAAFDFDALKRPSSIADVLKNLDGEST